MGISVLFWDWMTKHIDNPDEGYKQLHLTMVKKVQKYLKPSDQVLDYGCATGSTALEIAGQVKWVQGIDISSKMIAIANGRAARQGFQNINFTRATIFSRELEKGSFDVILASGILHLLRNRSKAIQRINELLKPGGWFVSSTACMGEDKTIPTVINRLLLIPTWIGIFPYFRFLDISELEASIAREKFQIVETETLFFSTTHDDPYIVARFIAANKPHG